MPCQCKSSETAAPCQPHCVETWTWTESEPAFLIGETAARRLVTAIEDSRLRDLAEIIESFPWFSGVRCGVRATRHLKPTDYIKIAERPSPR
jgi:hypothetical protein